MSTRTSGGRGTSQEAEHNDAHDVWARKPIKFNSLYFAHEAMRDTQLLETFFHRLKEVLTLIEANQSTAGFDTDLAWDMVQQRTVNVLFYGESGAGKSSLVKALTGDPSVTTSSTEQGTLKEHSYPLPCGLQLIDTPGFRIPLPQITGEGEEQTDHTRPQPSMLNYSWLREVVSWRSLLGDVKRRCTSQKAEDRPLALVYVHRASSRLLKSRVKSLLEIPHALLVPIFFVVSDVCGIDDDALREVKAEITDMLDNDIGRNKKGRAIPLIDMNSEKKTVRGHLHPVIGIKELLGEMLSSLDPIDALTFTRERGILGGMMGAGKRKRPDGINNWDEVVDVFGDSGEDDKEDDEEDDEEDESSSSSGKRKVKSKHKAQGKGKNKGKGKASGGSSAQKRRKRK